MQDLLCELHLAESMAGSLMHANRRACITQNRRAKFETTNLPECVYLKAKRAKWQYRFISLARVSRISALLLEQHKLANQI